MSYRDRSNRTPYLPPVIKIALSEDNLKVRVIALVVLLAIAFTALAMGVKELFTSEPGWKTIECYTEDMAYSADISLQYYLGGEGINATAQERSLNAAYGEAMAEAYRIFNSEVYAEDNHNVVCLNAHPGQIVTVDPALYQALELLENAGLRYAYMAPVYMEYKAVFLAQNDAEAAPYDPMKDQELAAYVREIAAVASDPEMVCVELLNDHQVRLNVSQTYLDLAEEYGIESFLDLSWMTNAFVVDYVADRLMEAGHTNGYLMSYDGYTRNLGGAEDQFNVNIFAADEEGTRVAGVLSYTGALSMVSFRGYPMSGADSWHYHRYEDGSVTSTYLDPADGMSKAAVSDLTVYAEDLSCAQLMAAAAPVFIADSFSSEGLSGQTMGAIWHQDKTIFHTRADAAITLADDAGFKLELAE